MENNKKDKIRCSYPGCKKEHSQNHYLELINKDGLSVSLPFCDYHFYIVMGGHFKAKIKRSLSFLQRIKQWILKNLFNKSFEKEEIKFELIGPLKEVEIAEQVLGAKEMIFQLKSEDKINKKV